MSRIKNWLKRNRLINRLYTNWKWRERSVSYGEDNPDKTFFVIRRNAPTAGLFSFVTSNLGWIRYAVDKGYIPVIDMQSIKNTYLTEDQVGKNNAWDFYFQQPCGHDLQEISHSKNVILSAIDIPLEYPGHTMIQDTGNYRIWHEYGQKYIHIRQDILNEINERRKVLFQNKRVLGVLCRGTDYTAKRPHQHPIQPEITEIVTKAEAVMQEYQLELIYLATEDLDILQAFQKYFEEKLVVNKAKRYHDDQGDNINLLSEKYEDAYQKGEDYLISIELLAECNCLVAGSNGGTYGALLLNKSYEYQYIYDLGLYE